MIGSLLISLISSRLYTVFRAISCILSFLKALIQPSCLARVVSWLAFVVVVFMGHENGEDKGQSGDETCKASWLNKSL